MKKFILLSLLPVLFVDTHADAQKSGKNEKIATIAGISSGDIEKDVLLSNGSIES